MNAWDFTVGTLSVAGRTHASIHSQEIACNIVENYMLAGCSITKGITHLAIDPDVDQTDVDLDE